MKEFFALPTTVKRLRVNGEMITLTKRDYFEVYTSFL